MSNKPVIGVVGLGAMGLGLAQLYAQAGHPVVTTDSFAAARDSAKARLANSLKPRVDAGKMNEAEVDEILSRITVTQNVSAFAPAALVIEAIIEKLEAKQELFSELEHNVSASCVLASNTSSLSIAAIMERLQHKERGLGLHFFNPVPVMKLVELVATPQTGTAAVSTARDLTISAGKTVITCSDTPGFIVNRCARPFYGEALALLEEGRNASDIDAAMVQAGYKLGPFGLIDLVGADINLTATQSLYAAMNHNPRYFVFPALLRQVQDGKLGRKTGQGFIYPDKPGAPPPDAHAIVLRIEAALANEAATLLPDGNVGMADVDTALRLGLNFPRGPFEAARAHGIQRVRSALAELEVAAPSHLKGRYDLAPALEELA